MSEGLISSLTTGMALSSRLAQITGTYLDLFLALLASRVAARNDSILLPLQL